jgi:non-specific serine/threonine protein kinase/serine/threonine-protein kinase
MPERARAERRFNDVRQLANSFMFEINEEINKSPIKARELLVTRALEYLDKLTQESEGDVELQSELATAYEKIGEVQTELFRPSLGRAADSLESHRKSLKIREALYVANSQNIQFGLDLAKSRNRIGDVLTMTGKQAEAVENYRQSIGFTKNFSPPTRKIPPRSAV